MPTYIVMSHSHLDREWYRTAEALRNRLVDALDSVLDMMAVDAGLTFFLDGQTIVLEDYLAYRPERAAEIRQRNAEGRLAFGPWYVQPDGFVPCAESIIRNLLHGRRVGARFGSSSAVGYLPDTFGHPAQLPSILRGFGLTAFCFRRGANDETVALPSEFTWEAADGSRILALYLSQGYSNAGFLPDTAEEAALRMGTVAETLLKRASGDTVLLMNGCDHAVPTDLSETVDLLAAHSGATVLRGSVDLAAEAYRERSDLPVYRGELRGAREDAVVPGTLSTRIYLKLANARAESLLFGLAEPFTAIARALGARDDSPALIATRAELLANHAHDSICGTSIDEAHREMEVRFRRVQEAASSTAERAFGHLAGTGAARPGRWRDGVDLAVFNPHPYPFSGVVQHWFDADPPYAVGVDPRLTNPPLLRAVLEADGLLVDGRPATVLRRSPNQRLLVWSRQPDRGIEFTVDDLPPLGWRRVRLTAGATPADEVDDGRTIRVDGITVTLDDDGTFSMTAPTGSWEGLLGIEEIGDAGDSYDFVAIPPSAPPTDLVSVVRRTRADGIQELSTVRIVRVPERESGDPSRSADRADIRIATTLKLAPGTGRVDVAMRIDNTAGDHRIRLRFPLADAASASLAVGPFDVIERPVELPAATQWVHDPPATFPAQGAASVPGSGLAVCAPGLLETEVTADGEVFVTAVRSVGIMGGDLPRRGVVAPALEAPEAQVLRTVTFDLALVPFDDASELPRIAREVALPLGCAEAGDTPLLVDGLAVLALGPAPLVLSALKPHDRGPGTIVRVWNPGDVEVEGRLEFGLPITAVHSVRLDETPDGADVLLSDHVVTATIPPKTTRSILVEHA